MAMTKEAQAQSRARRAATRVRIDSDDGQMYADASIHKQDTWTLRRAGDDNMLVSPSARRVGKACGTLITRNKKAVAAVLEALADFHRRDDL